MTKEHKGFLSRKITLPPESSPLVKLHSMCAVLSGLLGLYNTFLGIRKDTTQNIPIVAEHDPLWAQKATGDGTAVQWAELGLDLSPTHPLCLVSFVQCSNHTTFHSIETRVTVLLMCRFCSLLKKTRLVFMESSHWETRIKLGEGGIKQSMQNICASTYKEGNLVDSRWVTLKQ